MDEFGMSGDSQSPVDNNTRRTQQSERRTRTPRNTSQRREGSGPRRPSGRNAAAAPHYGFIDFIKDHRTHVGLGITLIILAVAMAIVTISHLAHGGADQSLVTGRTAAEIVAAGDQVENVGGALGAKLSHCLMADGLGIGAFVLVVWMAILGLSLVGAIRCKFWTLTFRCLFSAITLSVIVGLLTYGSESYAHWGGVHGRYINSVAIAYSDYVGAIVLSMILFGLHVSIYLNPLLKAKAAMNQKLAAMRDVRRERIERERERKLQEVGSSEVDGAEDILDSHPIDFGEEQPADHASAYQQEECDDFVDTTVSPATLADQVDSITDMPDTGFAIDSDPYGEESRDEYNSGDEFAAGESVDAPADSDAASDPGADPGFSVAAADVIEQAAGRIAPGEHSGITSPYDPRAELSRYNMPTVDLLKERDCGPVVDEQEQEENKEMIVNTLRSYNIAIAKIEATVGPTVTLYEIIPAEGVRIAQIKNLEDDIALSLAALGIRIIAPIPGKGTVGIEVPNREPRTVSIRSVLGSRKFHECTMKLPMAMGTTINNDVFIRDLAEMPHLLVAGGSGQGKSVGLNTIIASLLYYKHPAELKFVLIDPKMVEFSRYARLQNHYLAKLPGSDEAVITDPQEALITLKSLCDEMDNRYRLLRDAGAVKVEEYNKKFINRQLNPELGHRYLPYIVIIVDEFADLTMTAGKEVLNHIARIAQKARAVGMHMIIATQRPSTDVITGMIKANFLGRIAFRVQQMVDSKTILDRPGANQLIGKGDMLFSHNGKMERVQCAFIDSDEVDRLTRFVDDQMGFVEPYLLPEPQTDPALDSAVFDSNHRDALFDDCARFIVTQTTASTSSLQRRFSIGYNKAGKIMDQLEAAGIVGASQGQKPRAVLVDSVTLESILAN